MVMDSNLYYFSEEDIKVQGGSLQRPDNERYNRFLADMIDKNFFNNSICK